MPGTPEFVVEDTVEMSDGRVLYIGSYPFTDNLPRGSKEIIGRLVEMNGEVYAIAGIERNVPAYPYRFGEPVGLLLTIADSGGLV